MKLKDGSDTVPTVAGFFFSIFLSFILISYSYQKFDIMLNNKDAKILHTEQIANITDTEVFDSKMGLKIAVALSSWTTDPEMELTKEYGRIGF